MNAKTLREILSYCPESGLLTWRLRDRKHFRTESSWRSWNAKHAHRAAGRMCKTTGYVNLRVFGIPVKAHRVIFEMVTGQPPEHEIDHIDGDRSNNKWVNLRPATPSTNSQNRVMTSQNSSGQVGVSFKKSRNQWVAYIGIGGKKKHLGYFDHFEDAVAQRKTAERMEGFSVRHGCAPNLTSVVLE